MKISNFEGHTERAIHGEKTLNNDNQILKKTGSFNVLLGSGWKLVAIEKIQKDVLQVEEDKAFNIHTNTSISYVTEAVDMPHSTVQNIIQSIL